jgi:predicted adenylyl cyclase CyaB
MMEVLNVEIKARCKGFDLFRRILQQKKAEFIGKDRQVDTYFPARGGRLKLREGRIENNLIWYERPDDSGPKTSSCMLYRTAGGSPLKAILERAMGILAVVDKEREIYFIGNLKIHLDRVKGLGTFVEIEAQSEAGGLPAETLQRQCEQLMEVMGIREEDLVRESYSDLIMAKQHEDHQRGTDWG